MEIELVKFPGWDDPGYRDSGEGGLFVMLFVPEPEGWTDNCHVDVAIEATRPDVLVHPRTKDGLWSRWDSNSPDSDWRIQQKLYDLLREHGRPEGNDPNPMMRWVMTARSYDDLSANMLVAMLLGSTSGSFYSEHNSSYWYATPENLTEAGRALYDGIKAAYSVDPILATFLDT